MQQREKHKIKDPMKFLETINIKKNTENFSKFYYFFYGVLDTPLDQKKHII